MVVVPILCGAVCNRSVTVGDLEFVLCSWTLSVRQRFEVPKIEIQIPHSICFRVCACSPASSVWEVGYVEVY